MLGRRRKRALSCHHAWQGLGVGLTENVDGQQPDDDQDDREDRYDRSVRCEEPSHALGLALCMEITSSPAGTPPSGNRKVARHPLRLVRFSSEIVPPWASAI